MSTNTNFVDVTICMPMPLRSAPSFFVDALLNRKFTLRKFQTVKNLYQLLTAREKMVPVQYVTYSVPIFVKNTHVGKCHRAYMRIPLIDKIAPPPPPAKLLHFAFDSNSSQFCHLLILTSVTIKSQFFTSD